MSADFSGWTRSLLALVCVWAVYLLWRWVTIRSVARRIDASYSRLMREPVWTRIAPGTAIAPKSEHELGAWEEECRRTLAMRPLGRFTEHYGGGEVIGVRAVTVNEDQTIVGTFATALVNPHVAFRSFGSLAGDVILITTDTMTPFERPAHIAYKSMAKGTPAAAMHQRHVARLGEQRGAPRRIPDARAYVDMQTRMWREADSLRRQHGYVVDLESLRQLAPQQVSERTLRAIHAEIVRRHQQGS